MITEAINPWFNLTADSPQSIPGLWTDVTSWTTFPARDFKEILHNIFGIPKDMNHTINWTLQERIYFDVTVDNNNDKHSSYLHERTIENRYTAADSTV